MDITLPQKTIRNFLLSLIVVLLIGAGGYAVWSSHLLDRFPPRQELQGTEPALGAVSAFYAPKLENGYETWLAQVCEGMSMDGCDLLRAMYGRAVWMALEGSGVRFIQSNALILEDVETLGNGDHIWKLDVSVLFIDPQGGQETSQAQPYVQVSFNEENRTWLLERILFDQEIEQRYGGRQ